MRRTSFVVTAAGLAAALALLGAPVSNAIRASDDYPVDPEPRLVAFELFNRSQSGG